MRNLKKILALVLSLAMVLSVTAFAGFTDADKVDVDYAEAVTVLNGMGVFKGYTDGSFNPQGEITRAEVAAIVYRIATADVEDEYVDLWVGTSNFTDVNDAAWYAGYVGFCASNGYVLGYGDGTFRPNAVVKGTEVLAMILRVNGYDAEKEFSGLKWSDNVAKVAVQNNVLGDVKPGALAKAAPRELVAQLLFGALNADTVEYTLLNGYKSTGKTLGETMFDLECKKADEADDFGRPAKAWYYSTGNEESIFAEKALATYTVATENCDILADTGLDEDDKLDIYLNGEKQKDKYVVADDDNEFGEQGQLVEFYSEVVVVIDTFLGEVTDVTAEKTDKRGHTTPAYVDVDVYMGKNEATELEFETDEFAEGDMVLVTICDDEIVALEIAESEVQKLTKVDGKKSTITDIKDIEQLDKEDVTVAYKADLEPEDGLTVGVNYEFYYDSYGNVIGAIELTDHFAVVDSIYSTHIDGEDAAIADLVLFDASMIEDVVIDDVNTDSDWVDYDEIDERKKDNEQFYNYVYIYTSEDDVYTLEEAGFKYSPIANFVEGDVYVSALVLDNDYRLQISKSTEILLKTEAAPGGTYKAYTGYKDLPNYMLTNVWYADFDGDRYVDMLYAEAEQWDVRTVFIYDIDADSVEYYEDEECYLAEVEALELVEGELKKITVDVLFDTLEMDKEQFIPFVGLYDIYADETEEYYVISNRHELYQITDLTDDGKRADIVKFADRDDEVYFAKFDDAKLVKYYGDELNGDYTTKNQKFSNLNDESLIYVQYDEDGEEVVVYDMWVELDVEFVHECTDDCTAENCIYVGAKIVAPDLYFGKSMPLNADKAIKPIEVTVPAWVDLSKVRAVAEDSDLTLTTKNFAWDKTADKHNVASELDVTTEERIWADVVITLVEDPKHTSTWIVAAEPKYNTNMEVEVDGNLITVTGDEPTINLDDLKAWLTPECEYATYKFYNNTVNTPVTEGEFDAKNLMLVVTAEAGNEKTYYFELDDTSDYVTIVTNVQRNHFGIKLEFVEGVNEEGQAKIGSQIKVKVGTEYNYRDIKVAVGTTNEDVVVFEIGDPQCVGGFRTFTFTVVEGMTINVGIQD